MMTNADLASEVAGMIGDTIETQWKGSPIMAQSTRRDRTKTANVPNSRITRETHEEVERARDDEGAPDPINQAPTGDRLIGGEDFEPEMPLATDVRSLQYNATIIDFEDGRKATIVVTISS